MAPTGVTYEQLLERVAALESEIEALRVVQRPVPRFEQTLFKNEQRFRDLVEMMNEGLVAADPDDRIAFANRRAVELLGLRGDEAQGRRMGEFVVDGEIPLYDTQLSLRRGGRTSRYEITLRRADDLTLCVLVSARPVFDVEGAYAGSLAVLTDISERRRAEEALRSSESRLRDIVEHSTNLFYSHTADHVLTYVSPQARSFFACEPEEAMVRWTELVSDHPVNQIGFAITQAAIDTGEGQRPYDLELCRRDGTMRWVEVHEAPVVEDGRTVGIVGALTDVTDRRRMERLLRIERRLGLALSSVREQDAALRRALVAAREIEGVDVAGLYVVEAESGDLVLACHEGASDAFVAAHTRVPAADPRVALIASTTARRLPYEGEELTVEGLHTAIVFPIRHEGRVLACLNVASRALDAFSPAVANALETIANQLGPVISRFTAQASLERSEATLRSLVGAAPAGIGLVRTRVFERVNDHMTRLTGYAPEELLGKSARMLYEDDAEFERVGRVKYGEIAAKGVGSTETRWIRKDGTVRDVLLSSAALDPDDLTSGAVFTAWDVTERNRVEAERRRLELQVQHRQKLESLGMLAGGIAHDFNNILHAILGNANLAAAGLPAEAPACAHLREIERAAARAGDLCHQMLAYSGRGSFVIRSIHLGEIVRETVDMLQASLSKKIEFVLEVAPELPVIEADTTQMRQVAMNLVTNAAEAIGTDPGCVRVTVSAVRRPPESTDGDEPPDERTKRGAASTNGHYVALAVEDTGCGMDAETKRRLFEPFFSTKFQGRGLGLAAVEGIVRGHAGDIHVDSEPGRGTTVTVVLPAAEGAPTKSLEPLDEVLDWQPRGMILLADDEPGVRTLGEAMLESAGFEVVTVEDGRRAVEAFAEIRNDVVCVILDLTMPVMDGEEAFHALREVRPDVPVILCSGYSEQELRNRFDGDVPAGFLQKPFTWDALRRLLARVLVPSA